MARAEQITFILTGFLIKMYSDVVIEIYQNDYLTNLKPLPEDAKFTDFASLRMKLACLSSTRGDLSFEVSQLAQVLVKQFKENTGHHIKWVNKVFK